MKKMTRINFNLSSNIHACLKKYAIDQGISVTDLITIAICEKLEALAYEKDCKDAENAYERFIKNGSKTIFHEKMWKQLDWDEETSNYKLILTLYTFKNFRKKIMHRIPCSFTRSRIIN